MQFLDAPVAGPVARPNAARRAFVGEPSPASSHDHIVCAIAELDRAAEEASAAH
ncbi:hypothetical protein LJR225_002851 [Phenylobacterium sp. LjRoot225]|uniref:hypothetical protein n=1 Tax=Phenylobacterium sp. LjRoot225 TaxID=3342285 RepID=UPI003ECD49F9